MNDPALLSTAYLGPVQYYTKILAALSIYIEQHEHYIKQTYRNRCCILSANGVQPLTVPVVKVHGQKIPVRDVRIDYAEQWQRNHWKAIEAAYRSSPFFDYYADDFYPFYHRKESFLFDLNCKLLIATLELTGLKVVIAGTDGFADPVGCFSDYRYAISPKTDFVQDKNFVPSPYYQTFVSENRFTANLSILDLLCNEGPNSLQILQACIK